MSNKEITMPPTKLTVPDPDPFNVQAVKRYVFNETGNIMMASTDVGSEEMQQSVREVFNEVSVFFAAMTRAMATTINPKTNKFYSIYDYEAIEGIVNGSGLFVQVSEEDITHKISSWGVTVSKELIEGLLGLASGSGEMVFAQAMISSIGKRGLQINEDNDEQDGRVGTIVFVCEYLLGMPVVSALVCYVDSKAEHQTFSAGPCVKESNSSLSLLMHKDTYMFVTPNFIRKYAGQLDSIEDDLDYIKLVDYLQDLVERKPDVTGVVTDSGDPAPNQLSVGTTYNILGNFLTKAHKPAKGNTIQFHVKLDEGNDLVAGNPQEAMVSFTPKTALATPSPAAIVAVEIDKNKKTVRTTTIVTTPNAYTVTDPDEGVPSVDGVYQGATKVTDGTLSVGDTYSVKGASLLAGNPSGDVEVVAKDQPDAIQPVGSPKDTEVQFSVSKSFSDKTTLNVTTKGGKLIVKIPGTFSAK